MLCDYEKGRRCPSLARLLSLMDMYGVPEAGRGTWIKLLGGEVSEAYQVGRFEAERDVGGWVYDADVTSVVAIAREWGVSEREAVGRLVKTGLVTIAKEGF